MAKPSVIIDKLDKAARAGWLYYVAGNNQDEIARKLGVSRQTAQRLVSTAVAEGLIKFRLDHPVANCLHLAAQMKEKFGLSFCEIVPSDPEAPGLLHGVAAATAVEIEKYYLSEPPVIVALGTGRLLRACIEHMPTMDCPQHHTVSLVGNTHTDGTATAFNIVVRMAHRIGSKHNPMPLPVLVRNAEELPLLLAQEPVRRTHELCAKADVSFVGIGHIDATAPLVMDGFISVEESQELTELGAVGEIVGWVFDAAGNLIEGATNRRVSSARITPDNPRPFIGLAVGQNKRKAILAACRGRLINGLITDEATATAVLALA
ncbi:sugar-binding transcriptional regulator [Pararhodobacter oceanensis]|uniref:DNA-binding transcriptional regulator n=1 Tax=Pararhodobacter oceanensis TaxID=2172121 RepID=A0A2T8HVV7_9RHOB|nr:sugar-binding transcriptional regulator [Pararhodobacter oceanensis]PVH29569.1 DNA-binding transcriptional regulator [Pararhodobacter oceanensis]